MTTNQTIDGVPRALLADLASYGESGKVPEPWMVERLRGLLDAPACEFHQSADECETYSGKHPRSTAAQPHGDPVAWMQPNQGGMCISNEVKQHSIKLGGAPASAVAGYSIPLYAEQPAPDRPPHANPPPGSAPCGTHRDNDGLDEMRKPAMCDCNQGRLPCNGKCK